jgi:uncharacterized protein (TIGR02246 family)
MTRLTLSIAAVLFACVLSAAAHAPDRKADDAAIRTMLAAYQAAYSSHDAAKAAAFYAAEGDRRTADGTVIRGRAAVARQLTDDFNGRFKAATVKFEDADNIRYVGETLATVDGSSRLGGVANAAGEPGPAARYLHTILVVKQDGRWQILSMRNWPAR